MCIIFFQGAKTGVEKEDIVLEESDNVAETQPAQEISNIEVKEEEEPARGKVKTKYLHRRCRILCFQKCCVLECFIDIALD